MKSNVSNKLRYIQRKGKYFYKEYQGKRTRVSRAEYERGYARSQKIIDKKGKVVNSKLYQRLVKRYGQAELDRTLKNIIQTPGEKATYKHIQAIMSTNKIEKMIINAGLSPDEVAEEIGVTEDELLDPEHWIKDKFYTVDGRIFEFEFTYTGSIFTEVTR